MQVINLQPVIKFTVDGCFVKHLPLYASLRHAVRHGPFAGKVFSDTLGIQQSVAAILRHHMQK